MIDSKSQLSFSRKPFLPEIVQHSIAEFIGVFLYVLPGEAATAAFLLSSTSKTIGLGGLLNIGIAYRHVGISHHKCDLHHLTNVWFSISDQCSSGIILAITLVAHISGAHLSPGVTIAFAALKGFPLWKVIPYILAQFLGAIAATLCIYGVYNHSFSAIELGLEQAGKKNLIISPSGPGGVGAILPSESHHLGQVFFGEFLISTILGLIIFGALDEKNPLLTHSSIPYLIAMAYLVAIIGFAPNTVVLNTARGLGGQIATSMIYGSEVFENARFIAMATLTNIPATMLGGILYKSILENHHPPSETDSVDCHKVSLNPEV
ncbi:aquaporin-like protein [Melampsora americana]|nr:aquaporin-like protein [Melampsora americana]